MQRKLDLRTGRPVWSAYRAPGVPTTSLRQDIKTDVLVVGMGISGAMIAEALTANGHDVVCIDRRGPLAGSTAATTALVQYEIDQPLSLLAGKIGRDKAEAAWRRSRLAVANLQARIEELQIDCLMEPRQSLFLDGNVLSPTQLREEGEARRQVGLRADYLKPLELAERFGIKGRSALLSYGNLALDPRKLTAGLLKKVLDRKGRLYAPVEATTIAGTSDEVTVATKDGPVISARSVVLATGYELMDAVPATKHQIISTFAIATRPQKGNVWPGAAFIWEASDPYLYMRSTHDGRIICGGEDEEFSDETLRDSMIEEKTAIISQKLRRMFPGIDTSPEFAWAGAFGTTTTGLPMIGTIPRKPDLFAVMGYGGNGITYSQIASELIATALDGGEDTDAALFAFPR
ncbi:NAD(P)/FAD-dependent oxidoreductase [Mesorhizobium sp. IMUNJ 23232]|uniref:NAD(P)/FAD-dependent oxidoreductase n=1 Tax=Mesorhizobium sp. IMUNJ 23232 TaxID=3376064 RepID=UPI0037ADC595